MPEVVGRLRTPRLSVAPVAPALGEMYYDTGLNKLLWWDGSVWQSSSIGPQGPQGPQGPMGTVYDSDQIGTVKAFSGKTMPANWLLCDGRSLLRADYPDLFTVIGTLYGAADGTHFNVPDLRRKFIYGAAQADLSDVGTGGGAETVTLAATQVPAHSHTVNSHSHTVNSHSHGGGNHDHGTWSGYQSADHAHSGTTDNPGNHVHTVGANSVATRQGASAGNILTGMADLGGGNSVVNANYGGSHAHNFGTGGVNANHQHQITAQAVISAEAPGTNAQSPGTDSQGGGLAHNNLPPYVLVAQIIKATGAQIDAGGALVGPQGVKGDPGPWRGAWSAASAYNVGDSVSYFDGTVTGSYRRKVAGTTAGDPKTDTTNWELIASGGSIGAPGAVAVYEQPADPGSTTVGAIWIDTDETPLEVAAKTVRWPQTFALVGTVTAGTSVPGATQTKLAAQTSVLVQVVHRLRTGTATVQVRRNGTQIGSNLSVTTTPTTTTFNVTLADLDYLDLNITAASGAADLSVSLHVESVV